MRFLKLSARIRNGALALCYRMLTVVAWILVKTSPPEAAYGRVVRFVNLVYPPLAALYRALYPEKLNRDRRVLMLQWMLSVMTRHGFVELKMRVSNFSAVESAFAKSGRLILCSAHFGLTMAIFSVLENRGLPFKSVTNGSGRGWNWGCRQPLDLIPADQHCLLRIRKALQERAIVVIYADYIPTHWNGIDCGAISPNIFRFARITSTPILYFDAQLAVDGATEINVVEPEIFDAEEFSRFVHARTDMRWIVRRPQAGRLSGPTRKNYRLSNEKNSIKD